MRNEALQSFWQSSPILGVHLATAREREGAKGGRVCQVGVFFILSIVRFGCHFFYAGHVDSFRRLGGRVLQEREKKVLLNLDLMLVMGENENGTSYRKD